MATNNGYQGYTNHATWATALWIDNDAGLYHERTDIVRRMLRKDAETYEVAEVLKNWIGELAPDLGATLWADLLTAAIGEVNWQELAETWIAEEREEEAS